MRRRIRGPAAKGPLRARLRIWEPRIASGACESRRGNMGGSSIFTSLALKKKTEIAVELVIQGNFWKFWENLNWIFVEIWQKTLAFAIIERSFLPCALHTFTHN